MNKNETNQSNLLPEIKKKNKNRYNSLQITKYFKDQTPVINLTKQFEDPFFPANDFSLLAQTPQGKWIGDESHSTSIPHDKIIWKRASSIFENDFYLFKDKIECDDIKQGSLGNCYFLSAISSLTEFPQLIIQIFRTKDVSAYGYYEVVFFIEGEWQIVILDDYFPVTSGNNFVFAKPNGNELWVPLLEKAWAKVNGGYRNTIAGKENEALNCLTGFPSRRYDIRKTIISSNELWKHVVISDKSSNVMCTTTITDSCIDKVGLVPLHAYTLEGTCIVNRNGSEHKLVKIRNPWGNGEWNGKWSDNSEIWNDQLRKQVGGQNKNDGIFFMEIDDYQKYFCYLSVCSIIPNANVKTFKYKINEEYYPPKVYNIYIKKNCEFAISAIDKHFRFTRELVNNRSSMFIILCKYEQGQELAFIDGDYSINTSVDLINDLGEGKYLVWIWNDLGNAYNIYDKNKTKSIKVNFTANYKYYVKEVGNDDDFKLLKRIIYNTVTKGKDVTSNQVFSLCENMMYITGIGFRLIQNNTDKESVWENDASSLLEMDLLPPFNKSTTFTFKVRPKDWDIYIATRRSFYGKYWFNIKCTYKNLKCEPCKPLNNNEDYLKFLDFSIADNLINFEFNFYDYCLQKFTTEQFYLAHKETSSPTLEDFKDHYPSEVKLLENFTQQNLDNIILKWGIVNYHNGFYLGQMNQLDQRHGRGIYKFSNNTGYYGHWEKNAKKGSGVTFGQGYSIIYEGEFDDNLMNGKGIFYYANGDRIVGNFIKGIREGPATYYWQNGSVWKGGMKNNQLHGTGPLTLQNGKTYSITYCEGKQVK